MVTKLKLKDRYDVLVIGAGPAGLAAGIAAKDKGSDTLLVEREARAGGILKQCIHDGFGVITFKEKLSGPEYAERFIKEAREKNLPILTSTFVTKIEKPGNGFEVFLVNAEMGVFQVKAKAIVLSCGCRERTAKQIFITGTRPAGVFTAGTAQYFVNVLGYLPCRECVILGSGDIGLIMARRLTLEGAKVLGVYEAKSTPSGLSRNISQCLEDFSIPLHLSHTITKIYGKERVEGVEISQVDEKLQPIPGTAVQVKCDSVILSVGLIPENELAESLNIDIDNRTKGPIVNERLMTSVRGVFSCGNALHVNDLVDYVTDSGKLAGIAAAEFEFDQVEDGSGGEAFKLEYSSDEFLYVVPQQISKGLSNMNTTIYFRSKDVENRVVVKLVYDGKVIFSRKYEKLKPPEMEKIEVDLKELIKAEELRDSLKLLMEDNS